MSGSRELFGYGRERQCGDLDIRDLDGLGQAGRIPGHIRGNEINGVASGK